jgi:putative lipoprotein (rSAM/lipoprotein system)
MAIISKTCSRLLAILLAWLGFSAIPVSCVKYGSIEATYKAKGVVVSETDDAPIEGIRTVFKTHPNAEWGMDTVYTDSKGVFNLKTYDRYGKMYVELIDVDGEKNGLFNDTTVVADFSHVKFKGSVRSGSEVEKDLGMIKMKSKK